MVLQKLQGEICKLSKNLLFEKWGLKLPEHYVYYTPTNTLYQFTLNNSRKEIKKVNSSKSLTFLK